MWIAKIELVCFKSYVHQVFTFPPPTENGNIVLIGGMNGFGKTSLLEAIHLCLYGKEAMHWLGRTRENRSYPIFLKNALHHKANAVDQDEKMKVRIEIRKNAEEAFTVSRTWFFKANGDYQEEEVLVTEIADNFSPSRPRQEEELPAILNDRFVPAHLASFFFFDGEEIEKLADPTRFKEVKQSIESLLGVHLLRGVEQRLTSYQQKTRNTEMINVDEIKYQMLSGTVIEQNKRHEDLRQNDDRNKMNLRELEEDREDLIARLASLGGGVEVASVKDIVEKQDKAKNDITECEKKMADLLADKLPFHCVGQARLEALNTQLTAEIERENWEAGRKVMAPQKDVFKQAFTQQALRLTPPLDASQRAELMQIIDATWDSLFHPLPKRCAEKIIHTYLTNLNRQDLLAFMENMPLGAAHVRDILRRKASSERELRELKQQLTRVEGIDADGTLAELKEKLRKVNDDIDRQNIVKGDLARAINGLQNELEQGRKTLAKMEEARARAAGPQSKIAKAQRVRELISALLPKLFGLKTRELSQAVTETYRLLTHKEENQRMTITIDETGESRFFSNDREVPFDRSAGENQLFATALLAGTAKVSGVSAPLVIDTPLARLDSQHRKNLLEFWRRQEPRQVILLTQDEEIDAAAREHLGNAVGKTWLLVHENEDDGAAETIARENQYFWR
jgi:DNA sulfur modification protein DndD